MRRLFIQALVGTTDFSARRAVWVILGALLLTSGLGYYSVTHFAIDTSTLEMLDPDLPFRQAEKELRQSFPQLGDDIVVVIESETAVRANDLAGRLAKKLRENTRQFQTVYEPTGGPFFAHNGLLYLEVPALQDLANSLAKAQPMLGSLASDMSLRGLLSVLNRAVTETLDPEDEKILLPIFDSISDTLEHQAAGTPKDIAWKTKLFSGAMPEEAGNRAFVLVQPRFEFSELQAAQGPIDTIRQAIAELPKDAGHDRIRLTGEAVMDDEELASVAEGASFSSLLSFALVCLLTVAGLRSPRHVLAIILTLIVGLVCTGAFAIAAMGALNLISINFAVLFIGMGVDFGIQVGLRYQEEMQGGQGHADAVRRMGAGLGGALTLAAVAAAVSFFSFVPTHYRGLAQLGIIAGFGMGIALLANLTVLPALLTVLPRWLEWNRGGEQRLPLPKFESLRQRGAILRLGALTLIAAIALLPQVQFDFDPLNMKDPATESVATFQDLLADPNTTPYTASVLRPDLAGAVELAGKAEQLPTVDKALTLQSFVPADQDEKLEIIDEINLSLGPALQSPAAGKPPSPDEEAAAVIDFRKSLESADPAKTSPAARASYQRLAAAIAALEGTAEWPQTAVRQLRDHIISDLPESLDVLRQLLSPAAVTLDDLPDELKSRYLAQDGKARVEIFPKEDLRNEQAMRRFVRDVQGIAPNATDSAVGLVEAGDAVIEAAVTASLLALGTTALLLLVVLRKGLDTFLIMIPLLVSLLLTAAGSVIFRIPFDLANIIALPLLLGLSNAYGIYLILRLRAEQGLGRVLGTKTPRAIFFSALTEIISFGTLAFSPHRGMSGMGILVTLSLAFAVLATLIFLPAIIAALESRQFGGAAPDDRSHSP